eukprot:3275764-Ditylum_brightwellii.AAC.1
MEMFVLAMDNYFMLHRCIEEYGALLERLLDNGIVFYISIVHKVGGMVERARRRPMILVLNKKHVKDVWGDTGNKRKKYSQEY